jgi:hypothetical protein
MNSTNGKKAHSIYNSHDLNSIAGSRILYSISDTISIDVEKDHDVLLHAHSTTHLIATLEGKQILRRIQQNFFNFFGNNMLKKI